MHRRVLDVCSISHDMLIAIDATWHGFRCTCAAGGSNARLSSSKGDLTPLFQFQPVAKVDPAFDPLLPVLLELLAASLLPVPATTVGSSPLGDPACQQIDFHHNGQVSAIRAAGDCS